MESRYKVSVIHDLIQEKKIEEAIRLISSGELGKENSKYIDRLDEKYKLSPLAVACQLRNIKLVEALLKAGADVAAGGFVMRKSVLDYASDPIDKIILPHVKKFVDEWKESASVKDIVRARYAMLAFSLCDYYSAASDEFQAEAYFEQAKRETDRLSILGKISDFTIPAALNWRVCKHYFRKSRPELSRHINIPENMATRARMVDPKSYILQMHIKYDIIEEAILCNKNPNTKNPFNIPTSSFYKYLCELVAELKNSPEERKEVLVWAAKSFSNIARMGSSVQHYRKSMEAYRISNEFIAMYFEECGEGADKTTRMSLNIFKGINDTTLLELAKLVALDERFSSDVEKLKDLASKEDYKMVIQYFRQIYEPYYNEMLKHNYSIKTFSQLILSYFDIDLVQGSNLPSVVCGNTVVNKKLNPEHFKQILADCEFIFKLLQLVKDAESYQTLTDHFGSLVMVLAENLTHIDPQQKHAGIILLIHKMFECEIECLKLLPTDEQVNMVLLSTTIYHRYMNYVILPNLYKSAHIHYNFPSMLKSLDFYIQQIGNIKPNFKLTAGTGFDLFTLCMQSDKTHEFAKYYQRAMTACIDSMEEDEKNMLYIASYWDNLKPIFDNNNNRIFGNYTDLDITNVNRCINASRKCLAAKKSEKLLRSGKDEIMFTCAMFWSNQAECAIDSKQYKIASSMLSHTVDCIDALEQPNEALKHKGLRPFLMRLTEVIHSWIAQISTQPITSNDASKELATEILNVIEKLIRNKMYKEVKMTIKVIHEHLALFKQTQADLYLLRELFKKIDAKEINELDVVLLDLTFAYLETLQIQPMDNDVANKLENLARTCIKHFSSLNVNNNNNYVNPSLPRSYIPVLLNTYQKMAEWYLSKGDQAAALDCYNMVDKISEDVNAPEFKTQVTRMLKSANELMFDMISRSNNSARKIILCGDIIDNCEYLDDKVNLKRAIKIQLDAKLDHVKTLLGINKLKQAKQLCHEAITKLVSIENETELSNQYKALLNKIEETLKSQADNVTRSTHNHTLFTEGTTLSVSKKKEKKSQAKVTPLEDKKNSSPKSDPLTSVKSDKEARPVFQGGRVGSRVEAKFIKKGSSTLFPVLKDDINEFNALKKTNLVLYKELKRSVLEGGICREFGESGIKYLENGFWEAKINGKERLLGHTTTEERTGQNFIVFDTFLKNGIHRSK